MPDPLPNEPDSEIFAKERPKRDLPRSEWSAADNLRYQQTGEEPVNPAWRKERARVLSKAGLHDVEDHASFYDEHGTAGGLPVADLSAEGHFDRLRRKGRNG